MKQTIMNQLIAELEEKLKYIVETSAEKMWIDDLKKIQKFVKE